MIAFNVYLNGKKVCTAGMPDDGVLSADVTWVRRPEERKLSKREESTLVVGGMITPVEEYVRWVDNHPVRVGDEVRIKIVDAESVDRPHIRKRKDPAADLRRQKQYVRDMAKTLGWKIQTKR